VLRRYLCLEAPEIDFVKLLATRMVRMRRTIMLERRDASWNGVPWKGGILMKALLLPKN